MGKSTISADGVMRRGRGSMPELSRADGRLRTRRLALRSVGISLLVILVVGVVPRTASANPDMYCCGGGGGGGCTSTLVEIDVFGGEGAVLINGSNTYYNGNNVVLCSGVQYTISATAIAAPYTF